MRYLVDGYNLMYAIGLVRKGGGHVAWARAREQLLEWLAHQLGTQANAVTVIFDAQNTTRSPAIRTVRGLNVRMALGSTADDLIEEWIGRERDPETLTIVSNDQRIRLAAKSAGCGLLTCREYVDALLSPVRANTATTPEPEKPSTLTEAERDELLRAFSQ